jgi:hypothetical protein
MAIPAGLHNGHEHLMEVAGLTCLFVGQGLGRAIRASATTGCQALAVDLEAAAPDDNDIGLAGKPAKASITTFGIEYDTIRQSASYYHFHLRYLTAQRL